MLEKQQGILSRQKNAQDEMEKEIRIEIQIEFEQKIECLEREGIELIDCQVYTEYLESLGARMISGAEFDNLLKKFIP